MKNFIAIGGIGVAIACMYAFAYIVNFSSQFWWAGPTLLLCLLCGLSSIFAAVAAVFFE